MNNGFLSVLGLAQRAGKLSVGGAAVTDAIRSKKKPELVLICNDVSENTLKRITDACNFHKVELMSVNCSMEELACALGKSNLSACVAINDSGFRNLVIGRMK